MEKQKIKAVVMIVTDRYTVRRKHRQSYVCPVRVVRDIERVPDENWNTINDSFRDPIQARWAENLDWRLYKGVVSFKNIELIVWGWSFVAGDKLPLFWFGDYYAYLRDDPMWFIRYSSAWQWLQDGDSVTDTHEYYVSPKRSVPYRKMYSALGWDLPGEWLGDLFDLDDEWISLPREEGEVAI